MFYVALIIIVLIATIFVFPFIRRLRTGGRLTESLLSGNFGASEVEQRIAQWFRENSARQEQRDPFVQVCLGIGCRRGIVAERLMSTIMTVWRENNAKFGDLLAKQIESMIVLDPPDGSRAPFQQQALKTFGELKDRLRSLDQKLIFH